MTGTLSKFIGAIGGLCCFVGFGMVALYGYQLVLGPSLKADTTYRETETFLHKEIESHVFHTLPAEVIHRRLVKCTLIGAGLLVTGVVLIALPKKQ